MILNKIAGDLGLAEENVPYNTHETPFTPHFVAHQVAGQLLLLAAAATLIWW
jgi:hypothetical protein